MKTRGGLDRFDVLFHLAGQQVAQPAVGDHAGHRQRQIVGALCGGVRQHLRRGHLAAAGGPQKRQPGGEAPLVDVHPLAADPHQRHLGRCQFAQFHVGQRLVAQGQFPSVVDQGLHAQGALGGDHAGGRRAGGGQPEAQFTWSAPARRQQDTETCLVKGGGPVEEPVGAFGVRRQFDRVRGLQRGVQFGQYAARPAQAGQ